MRVLLSRVLMVETARWRRAELREYSLETLRAAAVRYLSHFRRSWLIVAERKAILQPIGQLVGNHSRHSERLIFNRHMPQIPLGDATKRPGRQVTGRSIHSNY